MNNINEITVDQFYAARKISKYTTWAKLQRDPLPTIGEIRDSVKMRLEKMDRHIYKDTLEELGPTMDSNGNIIYAGDNKQLSWRVDKKGDLEFIIYSKENDPIIVGVARDRYLMYDLDLRVDSSAWKYIEWQKIDNVDDEWDILSSILRKITNTEVSVHDDYYIKEPENSSIESKFYTCKCSALGTWYADIASYYSIVIYLLNGIWYASVKGPWQQAVGNTMRVKNLDAGMAYVEALVTIDIFKNIDIYRRQYKRHRAMEVIR